MKQKQNLVSRRTVLSGTALIGLAGVSTAAAGPQWSGSANLPKKQKIDTAGRGNFYSGIAGEEEVRRAYFNQPGGSRIEVGYSGPERFKLLLYAEVETVYSDRRLTLRLVSSDRGPVRGSAEVKFNKDRNEIETMMMSGEVQGQRFAGDFRRND